MQIRHHSYLGEISNKRAAAKTGHAVPKPWHRPAKKASVLLPLALRFALSQATTAVLQAETLYWQAGGSQITYLATLAFSLQSESFAHRYAAKR